MFAAALLSVGSALLLSGTPSRVLTLAFGGVAFVAAILTLVQLARDGVPLDP